MSKHTKAELDDLIVKLRKSISLVPIEFQLMYLYTLLTCVLPEIKDDAEDVFYTNIQGVLGRVPVVYVDAVRYLHNYRNHLAHEGISVGLDLLKKLKENKVEVNALAALVNVELNWDNSLNIDLEGDS